MKLEFSLYVLGLLLCVVCTMAQNIPVDGEFTVEISKMKVTLSCPSDDPTSDATWTKGEDGKKPIETKAQDYVINQYERSKDNDFYTCKIGDNTYKLYLKANVCENCVEMDVLTVAGIIIADLLITLGVLVLVYYFSKNRKGRVGVSSGGRPRGPKMARPPPVPNPDYEPIRKGQREVYAGLESRGF